MPTANINEIISEFPLLSSHAIHGEDVTADLAGLVDRLVWAGRSASPAEWRSTVRMIRGRLLAQLEALDGWHSDVSYRPKDPLTSAERDFYERAVAQLDAALSHQLG